MPPRDVTDLRSTIIPKSDQLNSEQLLGGPITVKVTEVTVGSTDEQPISIHYEGENGRPFKPCKTMRKVLIFAWGEDGRVWSGRSMTLYCDPTVKFGGEQVGGIRISHLSDIKGQIQVSLTATKGKKALHTIERLDTAPPRATRPARTPRHDTLIAELEQTARAEGFEVFKTKWAALSKEDRAAIGLGERDRIGSIGQDSDEQRQAETATTGTGTGADLDDDIPY
jgi:hypothetical protein